MNTALMFSTSQNSWTTPQDLFAKLDREFNFTTDAAADDKNHLCPEYWTAATDALQQDWGGRTVYCNPPYSPKMQDAFVRKAAEESQKPGTTIVMLLPARTDTARFHDYILGHAEIRFLRGRLRFGGAKNSAPFPSMLVIFRGRDKA